MGGVGSTGGESREVVGGGGEGRDKIGVVLWAFRHEDRLQVLKRAGLSSEIWEHGFSRSFGHPIHALQKAA